MKEFESFSVEALLGGNAGNAVLKKVLSSSIKGFESFYVENTGTNECFEQHSPTIQEGTHCFCCVGGGFCDLFMWCSIHYNI